jgi:PAS domain S-box-containing protein
MNSTSLKVKFAFLLTGFAITISVMVALLFIAALNVTRQMRTVQKSDFPRFSQTVILINQFEKISGVFEDAVLTGEDVLLEKNKDERVRFEQALEALMGDAPLSCREDLSLINMKFKKYFDTARELALKLIQKENADLEQMAGEDIAEKSAVVSVLHSDLRWHLNQVHKNTRVGVQQSLQQAVEEVRYAAIKAIAIGVAGFVLLFLFILYITQRIVKPIAALSKMTARVATGHFDEKMDIPLLGKDEISDLAYSFESMRRGLKVTTVSKAYVDNIVHTMGNCLLVVDNEGRITSVNKATMQLLEYKEKELLKMSVDQILKDTRLQDLPLPQEAMTRLELEFATKNGGFIPVIFSISLLKDDGGAGQGYVCAAQDITELKHAEAELEKRAKELANSNTELEQFAYVASHDLQEPLRMVGSYLQLLERRYKDKLDKDAHEFINFAVDGATRMKGLINDLLAYSRVDSRKGTIEEVNLQEVMLELESVLRGPIEECGAAIIYEQLPVILADKRQMGQLLQNLIGNAIKYRGERVPVVQVSVEKDNAEWLITIKDNGIGMEEQYLSRIFEIFQRLHTKQSYPGTGIGLAICKKIAERHKGSIRVESEPDKGSVFYVRLPRHYAPEDMNLK